MAVCTVTYFSEKMAKPNRFELILPNDRTGEVLETPYYRRQTKTLFLLHGYSGCGTDWLYGSSIEELALKYNLAVVMPNGENSFYLNGRGTGHAYADMLGEELVAYVRKTFGLAMTPEDTFLGGLSMGGYGAIRTLLQYSQNFGRAFALSSALIVPQLKNMEPGMENGVADYDYYRLVFGDLKEAEHTDRNPEAQVLEKKAKGLPVPPIYMACGTEDFLYEANTAFRDFLDAQGAPFVWREGHGEHNWAFWNTWLEPALRWLIGEED